MRGTTTDPVYKAMELLPIGPVVFTTDPVYKAMELLPIGPVVFIDTAGIDDESSLGALRIEKTEEILDKLDLAILVISSENILNGDISLEKKWVEKIQNRKKPIVVHLEVIEFI